MSSGNWKPAINDGLHRIGSYSTCCGCAWALWMLSSTKRIHFTYKPTFVKTVYLNGSQKKVVCLRGLRLTTPWTFHVVESRDGNIKPPPLSPLHSDVPLPQPAQKVVKVTNFWKSFGCRLTHSSLDTMGNRTIRMASLFVSFSLMPKPTIVPIWSRERCAVMSSNSQSMHAGWMSSLNATLWFSSTRAISEP